MSDILQSARPIDQVHPDADQLTAFAEHALPQHEQEQTLAHLAACADCREVVFLVQQAVEEEAVAAQPLRRPWFSGWNLVWPALVAVAGMVAFSVHLRNVAKPAAVAEHETKTAAMVLEQPPVPAAPPLVAAAPPKPIPLVAAKKVPLPSMAKAPAAVADSAGPGSGTIVLHQAVSDLAKAHGAVASGMAGMATAPAPATLAAPPRVSRNAVRSGPAAQQMQNMSVTAADQAAMPGAAPQQMPMRAMAPAPQLPVSRTAPAAAPTALPAPVATSNQTVTVSAAPSVQLDTLSAEQGLVDGRPVNLPPLPGNMGGSSSARYGAVWLALDPAGTLFRSKDQGKHWKRIKPQWDGLAAKIGVAQPGAGPPFELTTAAGVVWTSSDGQRWKRSQ